MLSKILFRLRWLFVATILVPTVEDMGFGKSLSNILQIVQYGWPRFDAFYFIGDIFIGIAAGLTGVWLFVYSLKQAEVL